MARRAVEDQFRECDDKALEAAVDAVIRDVLSAWKSDRPLSSLNRSDLRKICVAAICGFIVEKSRCDDQFRTSGRLSDAGFAEPI